MKIRNGFVSNSSSSSFIVKVYDGWDNKKRLITPKEEKMLVAFGFKKVTCFFADQVVCEFYHDLKPEITKSREEALELLNIKLDKPAKKEKEYYNYGYEITCNQDDIICFLLKNNIAFEATIHYNSSNIFYAKNAKYFVEIQNYGEQAKMLVEIDKNYKNFFKHYKQNTIYDIIRKHSVKEWLKRNERLSKTFDDEI